jgi:hypothetical protein
LEDWQIVYAELSDAGSIKLANRSLGDSGALTSIFRGQSLWIMDSSFVSAGRTARMDFRCGSATFIDSNAASYIRSLAYKPVPTQKALAAASFINQLGTRLQHLNPYLYLWEAQKSWNEETITRCKESVAAIHALSSSGSLLTPEWGKRFRDVFREQAENFAEGLVNEFDRELKAGLSNAITNELKLMEAILVRTQLLELSSKKSKEYKVASLVAFMHETISTMMLRELIVCGDILLRSDRSRISKKLNSLQNHPHPISLLKNCAWDLFIPRILDALCAATPDQAPHVSFYLAEVVTFDGDVCDILDTTKLRAIAIHQPTRTSYPFFENDLSKWLGDRVAPNRMAEMEGFFQPAGFMTRASRRSRETIESVLEEDRDRLLHLIKRQSD